MEDVHPASAACSIVDELCRTRLVPFERDGADEARKRRREEIRRAHVAKLGTAEGSRLVAKSRAATARMRSLAWRRMMGSMMSAGVVCVLAGCHRTASPCNR